MARTQKKREKTPRKRNGGEGESETRNKPRMQLGRRKKHKVTADSKQPPQWGGSKREGRAIKPGFGRKLVQWGKDWGTRKIGLIPRGRTNQGAKGLKRKKQRDPPAWPNSLQVKGPHTNLTSRRNNQRKKRACTSK